MCFSIVKYLLFAFNVFFWMAGAVILAIGIWLNCDPTFQNSITISGVDVYYAGAIVFIIAGSLMLVFGFFGCCGAVKENVPLLGLYFICLFIVLGLQIGIGIWAAVTYDSLEEAVYDTMGQINVADASTQNVLLSVERNLQCCGTLQGCADWNNVPEGSLGCGCDKESQHCKFAVSEGCKPDSTKDTELVYLKACAPAVYDMIVDNMLIIAGLGIAIGIAELFGMIFSLSMIKSIKD